MTVTSRLSTSETGNGPNLRCANQSYSLIKLHQCHLPETRASRLNGGDYSIDIVADDAESDIFGVLLDDWAEC